MGIECLAGLVLVLGITTIIVGVRLAHAGFSDSDEE